VTAAAADVPGPFGATATPPAATFALTTSRQFTAWLAKQRLGLAFTTYQAGRLFLLGLRPDGRLAIFNRTFERCMGLWASPGRLFMSTLYQLWRFDNALPVGGRFEELCFCPGYARGLALHGDFAVIGLSLPRHNKSFSGLVLDDELQRRRAEPRCGLLVADLRSGAAVHSLRLEGAVHELCDVAVIPGAVRPMAPGFRSDEIRRLITIARRGPARAPARATKDGCRIPARGCPTVGSFLHGSSAPEAGPSPPMAQLRRSVRRRMGCREDRGTREG
jgi:hypothetical protein